MRRKDWLPLWTGIRRRISLIEDKADDEIIDRDLRAGVEMRGTNLWVLMFAIFIASIGLNVNSTAVIIGAMLISPLMGPILGIGYGVGVLDIALIRRSLKNLAIAVAIALATSTLYFLVSPLTSAASELLARTTPTIWDVLVALFGGFAGIIGMTRREKSNIIPGVAIATALMPPLCTAGYGIARGNWSFMGGALFLFAINCVFIAFSSGLVCRAFHIRQTKFVDARMASRVRWYVTAVVLSTLLPSAYFAYSMVQQEVFRVRATAFVSSEFESSQSHVTQTVIAADSRKIELTLVGDYIPADRLAEISARLPQSGLEGARLQIHQAKDNGVDVSQLKSTLLRDLYAQSQQTIEAKDKTIAALQVERDALAQARQRLQDIARELQVLYPELQEVLVSEGIPWRAGHTGTPGYGVAINALSSRPLTEKDRVRIRQWVEVKLPLAEVVVVIRAARS